MILQCLDLLMFVRLPVPICSRRTPPKTGFGVPPQKLRPFSMAEQIQAALSILRRRQVEMRVGLTRSLLYARIKAGTFPKPVQLGNSRAAGWLEHEVSEWIAAQV